jgi:hypothetical protein
VTADTIGTRRAFASGLSSDFGWGDKDDPSRLGEVGSAVLLIASSGLYCASVWLAHGLPPLPHLAMRVRRSRRRLRTCTPQA